MLQTSFITFPVPWQFEQVVWTLICPNSVVWTCVTVPFPPHTEQVSGCVPGFAPVPEQVGHSSFLVMFICLLVPEYASSKVKFTLHFKSAPFLGPFVCLEDLPPPNPNKSPKSPNISPNPSNPEDVYE